MNHKITSVPVRLGSTHVGNLLIFEGRTQLVFDDAYWSNPSRPILGLHFEDKRDNSAAWQVGLPTWFENILPEGELRHLVAKAADVDARASVKILKALGPDLPGAIQLGVPFDVDPGNTRLLADVSSPHSLVPWNYSLAGQFLKLSTQNIQGRITVPAFGEIGNCILKLPSSTFPLLPINEYYMMLVALKTGLDVPEFFKFHRDDLPEEITKRLWSSSEEVGYGVARFDRDENGTRIHMEDFAQILNKRPADKYRSNFETVGNLVITLTGQQSFLEFVRRLTYNILIGNGDAHLKNWSMVYRDGRTPELSPVYDLVCDGVYCKSHNHDLGMPLGGMVHFPLISRSTLKNLGIRLGQNTSEILDTVDDTCSKFKSAWDEVSPEIPSKLRDFVSFHSSAALGRLTA